jgi:hypothetical protein
MTVDGPRRHRRRGDRAPGARRRHGHPEVDRSCRFSARSSPTIKPARPRLTRTDRPSRWGASQDAKDGGLDVSVALKSGMSVDDFIPRGDTGFQVKKHNMRPQAIRAEMDPNGTVRPVSASPIFAASGRGACRPAGKSALPHGGPIYQPAISGGNCLRGTTSLEGLRSSFRRTVQCLSSLSPLTFGPQTKP